MYIYSICYIFGILRLLSYGNLMGMVWESYGPDSTVIGKWYYGGTKEVVRWYVGGTSDTCLPAEYMQKKSLKICIYAKKAVPLQPQR